MESTLPNEFAGESRTHLARKYRVGALHFADAAKTRLMAIETSSVKKTYDGWYATVTWREATHQERLEVRWHHVNDELHAAHLGISSDPTEAARTAAARADIARLTEEKAAIETELRSLGVAV